LKPGVLFDMDGVLVFSEDAWFAVYNDTLAHFGHPMISREVFRIIYGSGTEADRETYMPERSVGEIDAAYLRSFERHLDLVRPNPQAAETLDALRAAGRPLAVATNTNLELARSILGNRGLLSRVDAVAAADEAGAGKPDPAVVILAARRIGRPLSDCIFVGDSKYDAEAARRAPVEFIGFRYGTVNRIEELSEISA
jgi:HAD superfamily hydrolase (TIGR01509 family)